MSAPKEAVALRTLAAGKGPLPARQLAQARYWVDADWESHDIDRDAVRLIDRLLRTIEESVR